MSNFISKIPLKFVYFIYWLLLFYLIAALGWWYFELDQLNDSMLAYHTEQFYTFKTISLAEYQFFLDEHERNAKQYLGEGLTFFVLTILGALFVYAAIKRQLYYHQQQRNFMMAVTHELKTPIAITKLGLETLLRHRLDEQRQTRILQDAINETERLDALCNNILLSAQLESGGYKMTRQDFDASELVNKSVNAFKRRYPNRKFQVDVTAGIQLEGEAFLIQLVINNLLENAIKYTPQDKEITIRLIDEQSKVLIEVADEGDGIPDSEKKRVFNKFYRMGDESKRKTKGTGLGLYLSAKIIQDHNGFISIENNYPSGCVFKVHLPKF
jgi:K+-sensing histidine kinase KdpD